MHRAIGFLFMALSLSACGRSFNGSGQGEDKLACTLMSSVTAIKVRINSATAFPANLRITLNSGSIKVDECQASQDLASHSISMSADRQQADVYFYLNGSTEYDRYFPDDRPSPASNLFSLDLAARPTCGDTPLSFSQINDATITWEPVYANGEGCGVTSYSGRAEAPVP